jgi:hypothetical protein
MASDGAIAASLSVSEIMGRRFQILRAHWIVVRQNDGQRKSVPVFIRRPGLNRWRLLFLGPRARLQMVWDNLSCLGTEALARQTPQCSLAVGGGVSGDGGRRPARDYVSTRRLLHISA